MSLETWKKEFYAEESDQIVARRAPDVELLDHSLRKWSGALPEALERHGLRYRRHAISEPDGDGELTFDGESCALCEAYYNGPTNDREECERCPIVLATGESCIRAYVASLDDAEPMTKLLEQVLEEFK